MFSSWLTVIEFVGSNSTTMENMHAGLITKNVTE
jgi:hypothetical protein